ncbi:hypothetical protein [Lysobacter sp. A289]
MPFVIPPDHPSLPGHFPGHALVPGVVLLDRVLDAVELMQPGLELGGLRLPRVKFLQPLLPGQTARVELTRLEPAGWRFQVLRGDTVLARGDLTTGAAR